jgi:hypothetical protein
MDEIWDPDSMLLANKINERKTCAPTHVDDGGTVPPPSAAAEQN